MNRDEIINNALKVEGWFDLDHANRLYDLANQYVTEGGEVLEVGSWKGRSSYILAAICHDRHAHLTCMDSFAGLVVPDYSKPQEGHPRWNLYMTGNGYYHEAFEDKNFIDQIKKNLEGFDVKFLKGDSKVLYKKIKDDSLDLCFIDGDHEHPGVDLDLKHFWPKVKKGGIFCGHDYEVGNTIEGAVTEKFGPDKVQNVRTVWS